MVIGRVVKGGAAERSGQLRPGDEVLEVNGLKLKGKSVHDICDTLCQVRKNCIKNNLFTLIDTVRIIFRADYRWPEIHARKTGQICVFKTSFLMT